MIPFADESATLQIADLTVENRLDRVSFYGSVDITRDRTGLAHAKSLLALLGDIVQVLEADANLPGQVTLDEPTEGPNPFPR